jgi:hydrogenase-4 component E
MIELVILIFIITILRLSTAERLTTFNNILGFQGLLLFLAALLGLKHFEALEFSFVILETLIFKTFIVPYLIFYLIKKNKMHSTEIKKIKPYFSLMITTLAIILSFAFAYSLHDEHLEIKYFAAAISAIFVGMFLIVVHENIMPHLFGYLVIENGVFLLSLAVGSHMPLVVNLGILLDIFTTVLILGVLVNRISDKFKDVKSGSLTNLHD